MISEKNINMLLKQLRSQKITDENVLKAISRVPREKFVNKTFEHQAWENIALPIEQGQTISQPYIVARMTELLTLSSKSRVLEIGTGSGYQTAVLSHLVHHVFSVERIKYLKWKAHLRLKKLGFYNISIRYGDGWKGWKEYAPFDAIIVTAASPNIPSILVSQLNENGILVFPIGKKNQLLKRIHRQGRKHIIDTIETVRFVPLITTGVLA